MLGCTNPITLFQVGKEYYPLGLQLPCGKCLACRIKKRKEWSIRMLHELNYHEKSSFVTLTYTDQHLPPNGSLVKADLQKFFKRLRRDTNTPIKYFACGEYGKRSRLIQARSGRLYQTDGDRPHYHFILYGIGLTKFDKELVMENWPYCDWSNKHIAKDSFGIVEPNSISYVAQYIDKKFTGDKAVEEYQLKGREPVFSLCSKGIGKQYALDNAKQIKQMLHITHNGTKLSIPRYYLKKLDIDTDLLKTKAIESDCEQVERLAGVYMSSDELYMYGGVEMNVSVIKQRQTGKAQHDANLHARIKLKEQRSL